MALARITGGGSHSHVWTQMFADALQLPIEVSDGAEVAARGVAMAAGISAGVYRDARARWREPSGSSAATNPTPTPPRPTRRVTPSTNTCSKP